MNKGVFVVIEGVDGAGKTALIEGFKKLYPTKFLNYQLTYTREPGGTLLAEKIRQLLLNETMEPLTEAYLFAAARTEHISKLIKPAIEKEQLVISDRFVFSSFAYQGLSKKIGIDTVKQINHHALRNMMPNFTFILDCNFKEALQRMQKRGNDNLLDEFIKGKNDFDTVRSYYLSLVDKKNCFLINGDNKQEHLEKFIELLTRCLQQPTHY
ncbi:dTMP kinase [Mycoplasmoides genitalium]|uniref:Thymidylate kinase n=2 Tax=Mycoplasmoides genitalium TaxID=2097 RepID=KTHY_MYCGE|nr:dTMP kinase [Mycoplasmoides genitalium]P47252.1 RecName: Full=Thymidylate kinase; AltName: Full=dTMP kinase [Mycoplasmoides genitalium G37]ABY79488.1 thymidylate kinase [synthetic Mycoplasma genitalium JCVI-1.0]AAC71222.1 thymidylate kinase [Mycoplasmoides genitalium G37]AFQ02817.1 thymidylate kinase [Mycoplasmoides genitalium M2321]AFQ03316.1 thymidylate kinase [Mycoplasmoides genitalium M6282]AFQ03800.1 thymidylate kinase [Mycoplasmoides genitalium M6320]